MIYFLQQSTIYCNIEFFPHCMCCTACDGRTIYWVAHIISLYTASYSIVALFYIIVNVEYPVDTESSNFNVYALPYIYFHQLDPDGIFCKPNIPVNFKVVGVKKEQMVNISLQYMDPMLENSPVVACGQHRLRGEDVPQHVPFQHLPQELLNYKYPPEFSFFSTMKTCGYELIHEHPTVVIKVQEEDIDQEDDSMMFNLVFICLNSCHKTRGKHMYLLMKLTDSQGLVEYLFLVHHCMLNSTSWTFLCCK